MTSPTARREKGTDLGRFCLKTPYICDAVAYKTHRVVFDLCPELDCATNTIGTKRVPKWSEYFFRFQNAILCVFWSHVVEVGFPKWEVLVKAKGKFRSAWISVLVPPKEAFPGCGSRSKS
jgi:hypothetical protein